MKEIFIELYEDGDKLDEFHLKEGDKQFKECIEKYFIERYMEVLNTFKKLTNQPH